MNIRVALLFCSMFASQFAGAKSFTKCEGWQEERAVFECSTGASYVHADARCRTIDTGWILASLHAKMKTEHVFCRLVRGDDPAVCKEDQDKTTLGCMAEFKKTWKPKTPAPVPSPENQVVETASAAH